jgi:hypothetical protein
MDMKMEKIFSEQKKAMMKKMRKKMKEIFQKIMTMTI